jgi:peptidyl-prolyl cis-trans isomerase B (cyclophilin B)
MKTIIFYSCLVALLGLAAGCTQSVKIQDETKPAESKAGQSTATPAAAAATADSAKKENQPVNTNEVAVIKTAFGEMVVEFWPDVAPKTVENFKKLARQGFYDKTAFHRIVKGFMVQGGDPLTKDPANEARFGTGDPGYKIDAEFNERSHQRGVLSMARSQDPNSAGSQFFICLGDASFLDRKYTAFGKLIKGDDVLGKLGDVPTGPSPSGEPSKPLSRQEVESIKIVPANTIK